MEEQRIIHTNTTVIGHIRDICVGTTLLISKDTDGIIDTNSTTAADLESNLRIVNNVVDQEMIRRYGE